ATPSSSPGSARPAGSGPAGSLRRTGGTGVALTFDDGPDPVNTPRLLDLLKQQDVKATFCVVGSRARAHPDLVRRIAAEGHTLCSHSWEHSFSLGLKPIDDIRTDLGATNEAIRAAVPNARISHFRAPGGFFTPRLVAVAAEFGMRSQYWEVDPRDWEKPLGQTDEGHIAKIIRVVQAETRPGSMILSHDFQQPTTITAYETLLPWLKERFNLIALPA
ncbi:MAG TPA: polysaccharide deacetylase family protein, partial [Catenuloplanes sp.]